MCHGLCKLFYKHQYCDIFFLHFIWYIYTFSFHPYLSFLGSYTFKLSKAFINLCCNIYLIFWHMLLAALGGRVKLLAFLYKCFFACLEHFVWVWSGPTRIQCLRMKWLVKQTHDCGQEFRGEFKEGAPLIFAETGRCSPIFYKGRRQLCDVLPPNCCHFSF